MECPIVYARLTLNAGLLARLAQEGFDREDGDLILLDWVGVNDPRVAELTLALSR